MPNITHPTLKAQRVELGKSKRRGDITERVFKNRIKKLEEKQLELNEAEEDRRYQLYQARKRAEAKAKREAIRKAKFEEEKNKILSNVVFDKYYDGSRDDFVYKIWKIYDKVYKVYINLASKFARKGNVSTINVLPYEKYRDFRLQFFKGSDGDCILDDGDRVTIVTPTHLDTKKLIQYFKDGISHCVFTPILSKLNMSLENTKSKDSSKRLKERIAKVKKLEQEFVNGVPEDKMESVAVACNMKISLFDILGNQINIYNEKGKGGNINFTNTRANHVDEGMIALNSDSEYVSNNEIKNIYKDLISGDDFFMIDGDIKNSIPRKIRTLENVYEVRDPNADYFEEMDKTINISKYRFHASKYPEVNEFIKNGRIINAWVTSLSDSIPTGHLDMPKAYTQFKKCSFYDGFLGVIHQWRSGNFSLDFIKEHIGIYRFKVISCQNELLRRLGLVDGGIFTLPSVEILYFNSLGLVVEITDGVWGSRMDFEFPDYMLNDRRYCLWSGRLGMERPYKTHSFKCDAEWASHLKAEYGDDVFYWEREGICSIRVTNKNINTTHHILAFITSYTRIQMIQAMMMFNVDDIIKVVLDGIYFKGEKPMGLEWFKEKEIKEHSYQKFNWYDNDDSKIVFPSMTYNNSCCLTGQGGAGKTFSIFNDKGFNSILFVSPNHVLGGKISKEYKCAYTTIHKLIGMDCEPYLTDHKYPSVIFIDELTQLPSEWIEKALIMYKDSFIFVAGDINSNGMWFQCRGGTPGDYSKIWKPTLPVFNIEGDRRSLDDELKKLKLKLREYMTSIFVDGDSSEEYLIKNWARKNCKLTDYNDAVLSFDNDVWISGTNRTSSDLLLRNVCSGWYKQGGFISDVEQPGYKKRGAFTCHSFQGQTVEDKKIFISIGDLFEWSMLYTAISRARHFNQLVFVV